MGLSPGSSQSGKRHKRIKRKKTVVGQIFREAVLSIAKSKHLALGAAHRRLRAKKGSAIAVPAIARKLAVLYHNLFTKGLDYVEEGVKRYEEKNRKQTLRYLQKTANAFGFALTPAVLTLMFFESEVEGSLIQVKSVRFCCNRQNKPSDLEL